MTDLLDAQNAPIGEPDVLIVGDQALWKREDLSDYDNSLHTLTYSFRRQALTADEIEITATADGADYLVEVAPAVTALWTPGDYTWQAYITRTADAARLTVDYGTIRVMANLDAATSDPRSHAKRMVDLIESVIENRAGSDVVFYMIAGRQVSKMPVADLIMWRDYYRNELMREQQAEAIRRGKGSKNKLTVRFI